MNALAEHIQRTNKQDHNVFLGRLLWYTVSDVEIDHQTVVAGLTRNGLGSQLPPAPRDHDIFRRVSSDAALKKIVTGQPGVFENYLIREIAGRGENIVTRRIVCEQVNRTAKNLTYNAELRDIEFNKETAAITVTPLCVFDEGNVDDVRRRNQCDVIENYIRQHFAFWRGKLNSYAVREFIRKMVLSQFAATPVRDGVYFVLEAQAGNVSALEAFANAIPGVTLHSLPLIDDKKQRDMVKKAFEAETIDSIDSMMADIAEIHRNKTKISTDRYARILSEYQELTSKTAGYGSTLETSLGEVHSRLSLFQSAVVGLRMQVRS